MVEDIGEQESTDCQTQGYAHIQHRAFPCSNAWLTQDRQTIAHRFNSGVRTCSNTIGSYKEGEQTEPSQLTHGKIQIAFDFGGN